MKESSREEWRCKDWAYSRLNIRDVAKEVDMSDLRFTNKDGHAIEKKDVRCEFGMVPHQAKAELCRQAFAYDLQKGRDPSEALLDILKLSLHDKESFPRLFTSDSGASWAIRAYRQRGNDTKPHCFSLVYDEARKRFCCLRDEEEQWGCPVEEVHKTSFDFCMPG